MKGVIDDNHIPLNKAEMYVIGTISPSFTIVQVSGLEEEVETRDLGNKTKASLGRTGPVEFEISIPMHHTLEVAAMELWYKETQDPVTPTYKKPCTFVFNSVDGSIGKTYSLAGVFPAKRKTPIFAMENVGGMATLTWEMKADDMLPI